MAGCWTSPSDTICTRPSPIQRCAAGTPESSPPGQDDRLAVRGGEGGRFPRVLAGAELVGEHDALVGDELLQRGEPEVVVALAVVALAALARRGDLLREPAGPLLPREVAALVEHHGHGEGLRL